METYFSEEECFARVSEVLADDRIPPALSDAVANTLTLALQSRSAPGARDSLDFQVGSWVIRNEDLTFFDTFKDSTLLFLATHSATPLAPGIVAVAVTIARLLWALYRRGVSLTNEQLQVFTALRQLGTEASPATLRAALGEGWSTDRVEGALASLAAVPSRGAPVELATKLPSGRWVSRG